MSKTSWTLTVGKDGVVELPPDLILKLRNMYGLKSKKRRFIKKAIKHFFSKALLELLEKAEKEKQDVKA
jgi:hypothetical protein